jgi:adenylyltransferase/sulfurtransferase
VVRQINVRDLAVKLAAREPVYFVDVRQPWEHEIAALPNSVVLPLDELMNRLGELQPADGALVVVYCHHGIRSLSGAALLEGAGFKKVVSLAGGIDAWSLEIDPTIPRY